tara:strand:- start:385 stop:840 length:456 start_codon:yes stop_codon:yes gene_type:complete
MVNNFVVYSENTPFMGVLYKTFYYDSSQFINGDYSTVNSYISKFTDIIALYETPSRIDTPVSTIAWDDKIVNNPVNSELTALESITISLPDNNFGFFGGSYTSPDGYYKEDNPALFYLKNNGNSKIFFYKLKISIVEGQPTLRKVELYSQQ